MKRINQLKIPFVLLTTLLVGMRTGMAFAGNMESGSYAYGENIGWINFSPSQGPGVTVTDSAVAGYAWGENIGWINLAPTYGGVVNDGAGHLSGYAWAENVGWINFAPTGGGVTIDPATGVFSGDAWGENIGWINFAPTYGGVTTSWRPSIGSGGGGGTGTESQNTPTGSNVNISFGSGVTVTFSSVSTAGDTTVTASSTGPGAPSGFQLGNPPTYYDISTTAGYTPPITVCIPYDPNQYVDPNQAKLFHYENGSWKDVTISNNTVTHILCGRVNSLSPFAVAEPIPVVDVKAYAISATIGGANLYVSSTVQNSGDLPIAQVNVGLYLSPDKAITGDGNDISIGNYSVSNLAANATNTVNSTLTIQNVPEGSYYVGMVANYDQLFSEGDTTNNARSTSAAFPIGPDLKAYSLVGTLSGMNIVVSDTEINSGIESAGAFDVSYYFTSDTANPASGTLIGRRSLSGLNGGSATNSATSTEAVPASTPVGTYSLCAVSDSGNAVAETNEANNINCASGKYAIGPDLKVYSLAGTLSGTSIFISDTEQNTGNQSAGPFDVSYYFTTDTANPASGTLIGSHSFSGLNGGSATSTARSTLAVPPSTPVGTYLLCAVSDSGDAVTEKNEGNNTKCASGKYAVGPDLKVYALSVTKSGSSLYVSDTEQNVGNQASGAFTVSFYLSADNVFDSGDTLLGSRSIAGLNGGSATNSATSVFTPGASGTFYVIAVSDSGDVVAETNEGNNTRSTSGTVTVTAAP